MPWTQTPPEVQHRVLRYMTVPQLSKLGQTSRSEYMLVKREVRRQVTSLLSRNQLPYEMLSFMKDHGVVLSGSVAVDLLDPGRFRPNDLDVFVGAGGVQAMHEFLVQFTAFVKKGVSPALNDYVRADTGIRDVVFYAHPTEGTVLNVIESNYPVATGCIFKFHTTFVMNYITHNCVVSAYPNMTEDHVGLVNTYDDHFSRKLTRCLVKYALRGYHYLDRAYDWNKEAHDCMTYGYCGRAMRLVKDHYTMRLCFEGGIGSEGDVIHENLRWRLANHYDCTEAMGRKLVLNIVQT